MHQILHFVIWSLLIIATSGCSSSDESRPLSINNQKGEYIYRKDGEQLFATSPPEKQEPPTYPWDKDLAGQHPKITKDFFRCKGSLLNPCHIVQNKEQLVRYFDCGGSEKHSLPLCNGKESIYPILIDILNYVQNKTGKRVVITSGHRCPEHNTYVDPSITNRSSKHMIAAETSFYVQGLEERPDIVINHLKSFYKEQSRYQNDKQYEIFQRYEKKSDNVSIAPWYNKEIFIKLFKKTEGRNFDNRHPYPYLSIQVRFDRDLNQRVVYSWDKANCNYHRW